MDKKSPIAPKQRAQRNTLIRNEEVVAHALKQAKMFPTVDPRTAAVLFGVCEGTMYRSAREDRFGVVKVGGRYRFPSRNILQAIGAAVPDDKNGRSIEAA